MRLTLTKKEHLRDRQRFTNLQKNCLQIVRQFYNNIPQGKIMTTLNILSSTVYVITTSEDLKNQEKSLDQKSLDCGVQALRQHCIKKQTWFCHYWDHCMSTVLCAIYKSSLCDAKKKPHVRMIQKHRCLLWVKVESWGQTNWNFKFFLGLKRRGIIQLDINAQFEVWNL